MAQHMAMQKTVKRNAKAYLSAPESLSFTTQLTVFWKAVYNTLIFNRLKNTVRTSARQGARCNATSQKERRNNF